MTAMLTESVVRDARRRHKSGENLRTIAGEIGVTWQKLDKAIRHGLRREEFAIPAVQAAKAKNISVHGPFPADTLFCPEIMKDYDAIVAMYHDQGIIPVKATSFSSLVNMTVGLPFIRTSPAHGTAFNIAGKNVADPSSMAEALKLAAQLAATP